MCGGARVCPGGPHSLITKWQAALTEAHLEFRPRAAVAYLGITPKLLKHYLALACPSCRADLCGY